MKHYFSPSTRGYYISTINKVIPEDAIEITKEQYFNVRNSRPSPFHTVDDTGIAWELTDENKDKQDINNDQAERENEKKAAQDLSGLKNESVANKRNKIHDLIDGANSEDELKQAIKDSFDKIIPWLQTEKK